MPGRSFPRPRPHGRPGVGCVCWEELSRRPCAGPDTPQICLDLGHSSDALICFYLKRGFLVFILLFKTSPFCLLIVIFCKIYLPFCPVTSVLMITLKHAYYSQHESCAGRFMYIISFNPHDGLREEVWVPLFSEEVVSLGSHSWWTMEPEIKKTSHTSFTVVSLN